MNNDAFQALIDLVDFDQKTVSFQENSKKITHEIAALEKQKKELEEDMQKAKDILHDTQKEVDMGELEMKEYDTQIKEKRARLDQAANHKEYTSYQKEIDALQEKQHDSEEPLIDAWNRLEHAKQEYKKKEEAFAKEMAEITAKIEEKNKSLEDMQKELAEHKTHREEQVAKVPKEWIERYEILGSRVSDPVVSVESGSCSACFYVITSQSMQEMRKGKLVQCKGCYRFLYIKKEK